MRRASCSGKRQRRSASRRAASKHGESEPHAEPSGTEAWALPARRMVRLVACWAQRGRNEKSRSSRDRRLGFVRPRRARSRRRRRACPPASDAMDDSQIPRGPTASRFSREGRARLVTARTSWATSGGAAEACPFGPVRPASPVLKAIVARGARITVPIRARSTCRNLCVQASLRAEGRETPLGRGYDTSSLLAPTRNPLGAARADGTFLRLPGTPAPHPLISPSRPREGMRRGGFVRPRRQSIERVSPSFRLHSP
jgi:hypothetical protein